MSVLEPGMLGFYREIPEEKARYASRSSEWFEFSKPPKGDLIERNDGAKFPHHEGEPLSWSVGSYHTHDEEKADFPKMRAVIRAMHKHRPEQLRQEHTELLRSAMSDKMFGHNAKKQLGVIESEVGKPKGGLFGDQSARYSQTAREISQYGAVASGVGAGLGAVAGGALGGPAGAVAGAAAGGAAAHYEEGDSESAAMAYFKSLPQKKQKHFIKASQMTELSPHQLAYTNRPRNKPEKEKDSYSQADLTDRYSQEFDDLIDRYARKMGFTKKHFIAFASRINELHKQGKHSEADAIHSMVLDLNDNPAFSPSRFKAAAHKGVDVAGKSEHDETQLS
jgi:hypothetical protein